MKKTLATFLAILAMAFGLVAPAHAELAVNRPGFQVRLHDRPCTDLNILSVIRPEFRTDFRAASGELNGAKFTACWDEDEGYVHLVFHDLSSGALPRQAFRETGI